MRRMGVSALLALSLVGGAAAHRLDEYLQATLIGVTRDGIDVEIQLTPGVAMLPVLMAVIDQDRDGRISSEEERAYVCRVARETELRVDGVPAPLSLIESTFPTIEAMREGLGTIRMKLFGAGAIPAPRPAWVALGPLWPAAIGMLLLARLADHPIPPRAHDGHAARQYNDRFVPE